MAPKSYKTILAFPRFRQSTHETKHNQNKINHFASRELLEPDHLATVTECLCHSFPSDPTSPPRQSLSVPVSPASPFRESFLPHSEVHHHRQILCNGGPLPLLHHRLPNRLQDRILFSTLNTVSAPCNGWAIPAGQRERRSVQNLWEIQL